MQVLVLTATLLAAGAPLRDPLAPYRDKPVVEVNVDAPAGESVEELERLIDIAPGHLLSSAAVQTALERLYALGRFSEVALYAERLSGAVVLHFTLKRVRHLASLELYGVSRLDQRKLRAALRVAPGNEVDRRTPALLVERARAHLARMGYPRAQVTIAESPSAGQDGVTLALTVREGEPRRVSALRFDGEPRLSAPVLATLVRTRVGGILDEDELARDQERLTRAFLERGFARVRVGPARIEGDHRRATVVFTLSAGPRVALYLSGNVAVREARLRALWPGTSAPLRDGDLAAFRERIVDTYRRLGYPRAEVELRGFYDDAARTERYLVRIDEGGPLAVGSISFPGARAFAPGLLVEQVETVLAQELGDQGVLERLTPGELAAAAGGREPPGRLAVPPEKRWVPEVYERVLEDIAAAYRDRGYLRATLGPARLETYDGIPRAVVPVSEGPETRVRSLSFRDNQALAGAELYELLRAAGGKRADGSGELGGQLPLPGVPLSGAGVEDGRIALLRRYRDEGYLYARVFSEARVSADGTAADVAYRVEEGQQVRIDNIIVRGNRFTRGDLIEKRMSLRPGELFRLGEALEDQRSLAALGVFSSVRVRLVDEEMPAERKDVVAEVAERSRQAFELGWGVSTADGPRFRIDYSHLNLAGTASSFGLSLKVNWKLFFDFYGEYADVLSDRYADFSLRERTEIEARTGVRSPRLRLSGHPVEGQARLDLVGERDNALAYSLDAGRIILGAEVLAWDDLTLVVEPQLSLTSLRCYPSTEGGDSGDCETDLYSGSRDRRRIDEGLRWELKLGPSVTLDLRDDVLNPRRGILANTRVLWGWGSTLPPEAVQRAELGEQVTSEDWQPFNYLKLEGSLTGYVPMGASVLALTARAGSVLHGAVPIDEKFYLGGSSTLRGFQEAALIPDEVRVSERDSVRPLPAGGDAFFLAKAELRQPLSAELLFVLFVDAGNLWLEWPEASALRLRITPGAGLRYSSPVGPIGIDVGVLHDPDRLRGERLVNLQFAVGVF